MREVLLSKGSDRSSADLTALVLIVARWRWRRTHRRSRCSMY